MRATDKASAPSPPPPPPPPLWLTQFTFASTVAGGGIAVATFAYPIIETYADVQTINKGQKELKDELKEARQDFKGELKEARQDYKNELKEARQDFKNGMKEVQKEAQEQKQSQQQLVRFVKRIGKKQGIDMESDQ